MAISADRIRELAELDDDEIPPLTMAQAEQAARLFISRPIAELLREPQRPTPPRGNADR